MLKWRQEATTKQNKQTYKQKNPKHPETQTTLIYSFLVINSSEHFLDVIIIFLKLK